VAYVLGVRVAKSTAERAAARLRQLSCFGLDKEIVIPEMLRELRTLVPAFSNTFHFTDERGEVENIYFENTDLVKLWPLYQAEVYERSREREFRGLAFSDASKRIFGVHELRNVLQVDEETFHRSEYYNLVVKQVGYASNFLRTYLRQGRRVVGGLTIWRAPSAAAWTAQEKRRVASLESFFIHAVTGSRAKEGPMVDSGDHGLIIADASGRPLYLSDEGRRLLFLAAHPRSLTARESSRVTVLPPAVVGLCRKLSRVFTEDAVDSAPTHSHGNVWGGFIFRAEWLKRDEAGSGLIGITVSHQAPLPIRLTRGVAKLVLSRRQAEVCVLLATGASNDMIADRLGISRHTANEHGRWIYNKLDVHSRTELVSKILTT
jgi:DNA-binding CsgD family transcriptional regulator